jgi:hypothetical protein
MPLPRRYDAAGTARTAAMTHARVPHISNISGGPIAKGRNRRTTDEFLINGPAIRNHRKPLKTNNRTRF